MDKLIIGLSGFARSGKDEAAKVLVDEFRFKRVAFADKLREVLYALNPIVMQQHFTSHSLESDTKNTCVQDVIDAVGWDGYKETIYGPEIRRLLQRLGTEAGRQALWDTIWIDAAFTGVDENRIVVTDARFFNEFDAIRARGGVVWRIERLGNGPANGHASEMEAVDYPNFDLVIQNDGSIEDYHDTIRNYANIILHGSVK